MRIGSIADYVSFTRSISDDEYQSFEWQANEFAGRLLVPANVLKQELGKALGIMEKQNLLDLVEKNPDLVISRISAWISGKFDVSDEVIETRARRELIWPPEHTTHRQSD